MQQISFMPVKLAHEEPYYGPGKFLSLVGYTSNRIRYAVKRESDQPCLPISEWIGYKLCEACGVPTPEYAIVECLDGEISFGSRWEEYSRQISSSMPGADAILLLRDHGAAISEMHAVDRLIGNVDRHAGNLIFARRAGEEIALAMDFSQAGPTIFKPFGVHPMSGQCLTMELIALMKGHGFFHEGRYKRILGLLAAIGPNDFRAILDSAPDAWFVSIRKEELTDWWDNERPTRLMEISP